MKILVVTDEIEVHIRILKILKHKNIEHALRGRLGKEALPIIDGVLPNLIIIYCKAGLLAKYQAFIYELKQHIDKIQAEISNYKPMVIVLLEELKNGNNSEDIKKITSLRGIDFCLSISFDNEVLVELFEDCVQTVIDLTN